MPAVTYIARRALIGGHIVGTQYSLDLRATDIDADPEGDRKVIWPLAGVAPEILRHGAWDVWSVSLLPLADAPLAAAIEFLESVDDQSFTFDPYGTVAVPGTSPAPFTAVLTERYDRKRVQRRKLGGHRDWFRLSFRLRRA